MEEGAPKEKEKGEKAAVVVAAVVVDFSASSSFDGVVSKVNLMSPGTEPSKGLKTKPVAAGSDVVVVVVAVVVDDDDGSDFSSSDFSSVFSSVEAVVDDSVGVVVEVVVVVVMGAPHVKPPAGAAMVDEDEDDEALSTGTVLFGATFLLTLKILYKKNFGCVSKNFVSFRFDR